MSFQLEVVHQENNQKKENNEILENEKYIMSRAESIYSEYEYSFEHTRNLNRFGSDVSLNLDELALRDTFIDVNLDPNCVWENDCDEHLIDQVIEQNFSICGHEKKVDDIYFIIKNKLKCASNKIENETQKICCAKKIQEKQTSSEDIKEDIYHYADEVILNSFKNY